MRGYVILHELFLSLYILCVHVGNVLNARTRWEQPGIYTCSSLTRNLYVVINVKEVQSRVEVSQEVLLVDLPHLISWHLLHQHEACGDGVRRHVLPAINTDVNTPKTVYCREEDKHRLNSDSLAQGHTQH